MRHVYVTEVEAREKLDRCRPGTSLYHLPLHGLYLVTDLDLEGAEVFRKGEKPPPPAPTLPKGCLVCYTEGGLFTALFPKDYTEERAIVACTMMVHTHELTASRNRDGRILVQEKRQGELKDQVQPGTAV